MVIYWHHLHLNEREDRPYKAVVFAVMGNIETVYKVLFAIVPFALVGSLVPFTVKQTKWRTLRAEMIFATFHLRCWGRSMGPRNRVPLFHTIYLI